MFFSDFGNGIGAAPHAVEAQRKNGHDFSVLFENRIDRKGRVSVPAPFRAVLDANKEPLVVTRSLTATCLEGQGHSRIAQIIDALDRMDGFPKISCPCK